MFYYLEGKVAHVEPYLAVIDWRRGLRLPHNEPHHPSAQEG